MTTWNFKKYCYNNQSKHQNHHELRFTTALCLFLYLKTIQYNLRQRNEPPNTTSEMDRRKLKAPKSDRCCRIQQQSPNPWKLSKTIGYRHKGEEVVEKTHMGFMNKLQIAKSKTANWSKSYKTTSTENAIRSGRGVVRMASTTHRTTRKAAITYLRRSLEIGRVVAARSF